MRRRAIAITTGFTLALSAIAALGAGAAQADGQGGWSGPIARTGTPTVAVFGTILSVDQAQGSFVADAVVPGCGGFGGKGGVACAGDDVGHGDGAGQPGDRGHGGPWQPQARFHGDWLRPAMQPAAATQVTITTNTSTKVKVDGRAESVAQLAQGDRFVALLAGSRGDSLQTLVSNPAVAVYAHTPPANRQLYAFVGTVTAVNPAASGGGTIGVQVTESIPSGLVPAASNPATFTISTQTLVLGGSDANGLFGGSINDFAIGDVVAGGLIGTSGETLTQVESTPLQAAIDFPAAPAGTQTAASVRHARAKALSQAMALFGYHSHAGKRAANHHRGRAHRRQRGDK
ncbi:MAG: hypothetical protein ACRDL5_04225 [Solirubrobacteraceae bacterium]